MENIYMLSSRFSNIAKILIIYFYPSNTYTFNMMDEFLKIYRIRLKIMLLYESDTFNLKKINNSIQQLLYSANEKIL